MSEGISYRPTVFGLMLEYPLPPDADMVIVCIDLIQHTPIRLLLTHQVYLERMRELLAQYPHARGITLIPCRSSEKVTLTAKEIAG